MPPVAGLLRLHPQALVAAGAVAAAGLGVGVYLAFRRRPSAEEREQRRRGRLALHGRIVDGTLIEAAPDGSPATLLYRYRVSGVTYECGQSVSSLAPMLPELGPAVLGTPVQVRYDRDNPADSIIVAEDWNGLWSQARIPAEEAL